MQIIPLSEGAFTIDKTKVFVPFDLNTHELNERPIGSLLVEIQPFVIITEKDIILIDTGLGFKVEGKLQIHQNLLKNGIEPNSVTKVLLSHLHKDHSGGIAQKDRLGHYSLAFPHATYYLQQKELDFAFETGFPSYITDELSVLNDHSNVVLLDDEGVIDGYIHYEICGGHCPFHQAFTISENGKTVFFGGDVAPQLQQMKSKFIAKYDYDGRRSMELRQQWWKQAQEENWTILFYHDIKTPTISF